MESENWNLATLHKVFYNFNWNLNSYYKFGLGLSPIFRVRAEIVDLIAFTSVQQNQDPKQRFLFFLMKLWREY